MWYLLASPQTSSMTSMLPLQRGNTRFPASVRIQKARAKVDKVLTTKIRTVVREVEATGQPMAKIGLTVSGMTQPVNFARNLTLPVSHSSDNQDKT